MKGISPLYIYSVNPVLRLCFVLCAEAWRAEGSATERRALPPSASGEFPYAFVAVDGSLTSVP